LGGGGRHKVCGEREFRANLKIIKQQRGAFAGSPRKINKLGAGCFLPGGGGGNIHGINAPEKGKPKNPVKKELGKTRSLVRKNTGVGCP